MEYDHIKNNSNKLIIIFQSVGQIPAEEFDKILNGEVSSEQIKNYHSNYNYMKIAVKNSSFDYLFIKDYYSQCYRWYIVDSGEFIVNKLNEELTEFLCNNKYKYVYAFGSSKGASGALIYGNINKYITHVLALVPQIEIAKFINGAFGRYKDLFFNNKVEFEREVDNFLYKIYSIKNIYDKKKIYLYSGMYDNQVQQILKLYNISIKNGYEMRLLFNRTDEKHTPLVINHLPLLEDILFNLNDDEYVKSKTFVLTENIFLI